MRVKDEMIVWMIQVNRAVNHETRGIHVRRTFEHIAVFVDLDQVGRGHLFVKQPETVHQEGMIGARHARGDVVPHRVVPPKQVGQAKHRGEIDAHVPLGRAGLDRALGVFECLG